MNKLLVAGHPGSGIDRIDLVLSRFGVQPALPSLRENRRPQAILNAMSESLGAPRALDPRTEDEFHQIQPGQAWRNCAADLILGNASQPSWFWSSPAHLPFLDFWTEQDGGIMFLLLYSSPECAFHRSPGQSLKPEELQHRLDNWCAYHSALLRFHLRHKDRSLLVHGRTALRSPDRLRVALAQKMFPLMVGQDPPSMDDLLASDPETEAASRFLIEELVFRHPSAPGLREELDVSADLAAESDLDIPPEQALSAWFEHLGTAETLALQDMEKEQSHELFVRQLVETQESLERNYLDLQGYKWRLSEAERLLAAPRGAAQRVKQQLAYRIGSTLVHGSKSAWGVVTMPFVLLTDVAHFLVTSTRTRKDILPPLRDYADFEDAERVKRQLSYRLGRTVLRGLRSPSGWLRLPAAIAAEISARKKPQVAGEAVEQQP